MCDLQTLTGILNFAEIKLNSPSSAKRELDKATKENIAEKLDKLEESPDHIHFRYTGTSSDRPYEIFLELQRNAGQGANEPPDWAVVTCTCPVGEKKPLCKHGMAALLYCLPERERPGAPSAAPPPPNSANAGNSAMPVAPAASPAMDVPKPPESTMRIGRRNIPSSFLASKNKPTEAVKGAKDPGPPAKRAKTAPKNTPAPRSAVYQAAKPRVPNIIARRWLTSEEMEMADDGELLEQCKKVLLLEEEGPFPPQQTGVEIPRERRIVVPREGPIADRLQQGKLENSADSEMEVEVDLTRDSDSEEDLGIAPAAVAAVAPSSLRSGVPAESPAPFQAAQAPPIAAQEVPAQPPPPSAPAPVNEDEFSFLSLFHSMNQ